MRAPRSNPTRQPLVGSVLNKASLHVFLSVSLVGGRSSMIPMPCSVLEPADAAKQQQESGKIPTCKPCDLIHCVLIRGRWSFDRGTWGQGETNNRRERGTRVKPNLENVLRP